MRYVTMVLKIIVILAAAGACAMLAGRFGPWKALGMWAAIWGVLCVGIALAVSRQPAGRITVLNLLMGYILQWGYRIGRGKLSNITLISWCVWMLLGGAAILATRVHLDSAAESQARSKMVMVLLVLSWIIDGAALFYILGIIFSQGRSGRQLGVLGPVAGILLLMILGSAALVVFNSSAGAAMTALLLAGGPMLLLGLFYAIFVVVIVVCGRKTRWN